MFLPLTLFGLCAACIVVLVAIQDGEITRLQEGIDRMREDIAEMARDERGKKVKRN